MNRRLRGRAAPTVYRPPEVIPGYYELPLLEYEARFGHTGSVHRYVNGVACFTVNKHGHRMLIEIRGTGPRLPDDAPRDVET